MLPALPTLVIHRRLTRQGQANQNGIQGNPVGCHHIRDHLPGRILLSLQMAIFVGVTNSILLFLEK